MDIFRYQSTFFKEKIMKKLKKISGWARIRTWDPLVKEFTVLKIKAFFYGLKKAK